MYVIVELWNARASWWELSSAQRQAFLDHVTGHMSAVTDPVPVAWGFADRETDRDAGYDLFAVWHTDHPAAVDRFLTTLRATDWYDHFEQVNTTGAATPGPPEVLEALATATSIEDAYRRYHRIDEVARAGARKT